MVSTKKVFGFNSLALSSGGKEFNETNVLNFILLTALLCGKADPTLWITMTLLEIR